MRADDRVHRAGLDTARAADAAVFVDSGNGGALHSGE